MTRRLAALVAGIILAGAGALLPALTVLPAWPILPALPALPASPAQALPLQQAPRQGPACPVSCDSVETAQAAPDLLLLGEATTVTVHSKIVCAGQARPMHIAIVVVQSDGIGRNELRETQGALQKLITRLDLKSDPSTQLALIESKDEARTLVHMTDDPKLLARGIGRLDQGGVGDLEGGINAAMRELRRARISLCPRPDPYEILLLIGAEPADGRCPEAERAAGQTKGQSVRVVSVCVGRNCRATRCIPQLASSRRYFFQLANGAGLVQVFERIRDGAISHMPQGPLEIVESLPPELSYAADSARPPARYDPATRALRWFIPTVPRDGVTVTWQARPHTPGLQTTSRGAELRWSFIGFDPLTKTLAPAWVQVFAAPEP